MGGKLLPKELERLTIGGRVRCGPGTVPLGAGPGGPVGPGGCPLCKLMGPLFSIYAGGGGGGGPFPFP